MEKIAIITLGCKTNQYESQAVGEILEAQGFQVCHSVQPADIYIVNTCAVTNEAERKSRQTISKLVKLNPKCKIYICGCASQNNAEQFKNLQNVKFVIGNSNRLELVSKISGQKVSKTPRTSELYDNLHISKPTNARAYIKIQDGCNRFCSYCLIPHLRGRSRSRDILSILQEFDALTKAGAQEIVLTGIDISDYQIDDQPALIDLLEQLDTFGARYRLGSIEPNLITPQNIARLKRLNNFCPHFHISMQSGATPTLKRMNRHYTADFFVRATRLLHKKFPNCAITTDLIVGFPGETDKEFAQTLKTIKKAKFSQMHIFPFSRRAGTTADKLLTSKQNPEFFAVDPQQTKQRTKTALALAKKLETKYLQKQKNKILFAVIEEKQDDFLIGTTENYVKTYIQTSCKNLENTIQKVKIIGVFQDGVLATLLSENK